MSSTIDIGIAPEQRQQIADGLGRLLADTWVLYGKTHGFHWNVTGPMFNSLHGMFDTQYNELWDSLDEIAERIRALGIAAPFGDSKLTQLATIKEADSIPAAMEMVAQLVADHEAVARTARSVFEIADAANDQPSADLLTQRLQVHEKTAWMLRSLIQN
ncbi:MAG: Dps family protein [Synechococcus sp.]|nr:Dps family protein [Synechococcus sp.]